MKKYSNITNLNLTENKFLNETVNKDIREIKKIGINMQNKIKMIENLNNNKTLNRKYRIDNLKNSKELNNFNSINFYHNLSLIMLSMLGGGLVGIIFILYFTLKPDQNDK